ncbi:MAG TPA: L,D-transpeptidase family protein [Pyrinomonadaceae bacterium]|jgi:lipoprotein-anchoring transpeptidase ErfK/SrfK|nr:L,D-transpeptidase family protein [Pyrinomonadaceae bacterium]
MLTRLNIQTLRVAQLRSWPIFLILFFLPFTILAGGVIQARGRAKKGVAQEVSKEEILTAERRLSDLGYWTGPVDGTLDSGSRHALIAFQKVEGRQRTGKLTRVELQALLSAQRPLPKYSGDAHVEVALNRQVLFLVDTTGTITHILPVCTGNEKTYMDHGEIHRAHTPRGRFRVLRKLGGWRLSSLGLLYYPNYIHNGIAIHGSPAMTVYPASHGCIRIPMFASKKLSELTPVGTEVIVYD